VKGNQSEGMTCENWLICLDYIKTIRSVFLIRNFNYIKRSVYIYMGERGEGGERERERERERMSIVS